MIYLTISEITKSVTTWLHLLFTVRAQLLTAVSINFPFYNMSAFLWYWRYSFEMVRLLIKSCYYQRAVNNCARTVCISNRDMFVFFWHYHATQLKIEPIWCGILLIDAMIGIQSFFLKASSNPHMVWIFDHILAKIKQWTRSDKWGF